MSVLRCVTWAREQGTKLPGPHAHALLVASTYANAAGECAAAAETIGERIGYCRQEAQGLLGDLTKMGLLHPGERRGRQFIRRLRMDAPSPDQLQLAAAAAPMTDLAVGSRRRQRASTTVSGSGLSGVGLEAVHCRVPGGDTKYEVPTEEPPTPLPGGRARDRAAYGTALRDWSLRLLPGAGEEELGAIREAIAMVRYRDRIGNPDAPPVSRQEILDYLREHRPDIVLPDSERSEATA